MSAASHGAGVRKAQALHQQRLRFADTVVPRARRRRGGGHPAGVRRDGVLPRARGLAGAQPLRHRSASSSRRAGRRPRPRRHAGTRTPTASPVRLRHGAHIGHRNAARRSGGGRSRALHHRRRARCGCASRWPTSSTCSRRCPASSTASGASSRCCRRCTRSRTTSRAGSAASRSSERSSPARSSGPSYFAAGIVLAIMVLPIVTAICREVFAVAPVAEKEAALALGATRWEMLRISVLKRSTRRHLRREPARPRPRLRRDDRGHDADRQQRARDLDEHLRPGRHDAERDRQRVHRGRRSRSTSSRSSSSARSC